MNENKTPRFELPLLAVGQAHKELFHNESLLLLDFLTQPTVLAVANDPALLSPAAGDCWLIGPAPLGDWADRSDQIAGWSDGGWHYIKPQESMKIIILNDNSSAVFYDAAWQFISQVGGPVAGAIIDSEARTAIDSILSVLRETRILPQIN